MNKTFNYFSKLLEDLNVVQFTDKQCLNTEELNRTKKIIIQFITLIQVI